MRFTLALCMLTALLLPALAGCTTTIVPPSTPDDGISIFVLDHGYSSSLVLPDRYGTVRYAYGDWAYYALADTGVLEAGAALLWPTRAGLGRRQLSAPPVAEAVRRQVGVRVEAMHTVRVGRERAAVLATRLDRAFVARAEQMVVNPEAELRFVPAARDYHVFYNSNHAVAAWLEAMGAEVRGTPIVSRWRVVERADH